MDWCVVWFLFVWVFFVCFVFGEEQFNINIILYPVGCSEENDAFIG